MKSLFILLVFTGVYATAFAQRPDTISITQVRSLFSIRQLVAIPTSYTIVSYEVGISGKNETCRKSCIDDTMGSFLHSVNIFNRGWLTLFVDKIVVRKDGKETKWMGKTFVLR